MLLGLRGWVECGSPTWDAVQWIGMLDIAAREMAIMGASISAASPVGRVLALRRGAVPHPKQGEPGILYRRASRTGHPVGTGKTDLAAAKATNVFGPRHLDMKGGNVPDAGSDPAIGARLGSDAAADHGAFTPDEESARRQRVICIEAEAARNKYVLVPEPGRSNNGASLPGVIAIARFNLEATGKPSHAGATLSSGRSAIREMARQIIAIDGIDDGGLHFSVGIVHGASGSLRRHHLQRRSG